jgi:hypothetical protein
MNGEADCARAPKGTYCTLPAGHEGPCELWPKPVSRETSPWDET